LLEGKQDKKILIDKEAPNHFPNDDLIYKDYQEVRKWIIEQTGSKEHGQDQKG